MGRLLWRHNGRKKGVQGDLGAIGKGDQNRSSSSLGRGEKGGKGIVSPVGGEGSTSQGLRDKRNEKKGDDSDRRSSEREREGVCDEVSGIVGGELPTI